VACTCFQCVRVCVRLSVHMRVSFFFLHCRIFLFSVTRLSMPLYHILDERWSSETERKKKKEQEKTKEERRKEKKVRKKEEEQKKTQK